VQTLANTKEALFYYIYGLLHSPDYRSRYADFQAFSQASRDLAHWHLKYETVACYEDVTIEGDAGTPACNLKSGGAAAKSPKQTGVSASLYLNFSF
jgi:hypothetical protein